MFAQAAISVLLASLVFSGAHAQGSKSPAVAVMEPDAMQVTGTLFFFQPNPNGPVTVRGKLSGLDANAVRGLHIHEFGDLSDKCTSTGEHWNPEGTTHGNISNPLRRRHRGDLGNIRTNGKGEANINITDKTGGLSLYGNDNIVGRAIVVHTGTDDLGLTRATLSKINGNSGMRAACGVIGFSNMTTFGVPAPTT